jgi:methylated-DNA-protein-cysteine methyltransferase-like protein
MAGELKTKSGVSYQQDVWRVVKQIPKGKVATYAMIAKRVGIDPRMAGWALHANTSANVPCHRVVNKEGRLAPNFAFDGWREQRRRLLLENVKFKSEMYVDLKVSLWKV